MCANFKPISIAQLSALGLPEIPFEYAEEAYPNSSVPLLFKSEQGLRVALGEFWLDSQMGGRQKYCAKNL